MVFFEWDESKNKTNQTKHSIAFETAAKVFEDENLVLLEDRVTDGEVRWHAIGMVEAAVLVVVHVYIEEGENEDDETIRIISAREADKSERGLYFQPPNR